jgi:hypothetical protein
MKIRQGQEHFSTAPAITNPRLQSFEGIRPIAGSQTRNRPFPQVKRLRPLKVRAQSNDLPSSVF